MARSSLIVPAAVLFCGLLAAAQRGPCYVSVPDTGGGESCIFFGAGVASEEDCQVFESELGRGTQLPTSYAYRASEQACAIRAPGSCQVFASVLSLQVCSSNSAQAVQQILSSSAFQTGPEAPTPAPGPSGLPGSCYSSLRQGQDDLCVLLAVGLSSAKACSTAGDQIADALPNKGEVKTFYRPSSKACGVVVPGSCGSLGAAIGVQAPPCEQSITQQLQALTNAGLYPAGAPAVSRAPSISI